jgi:2-polyprenyl-6-methoxyphenol hydroxylase-like FAD-dependent oxidoreductase
MATTKHDVLIAGGGPTGMMLAAELTIAGVDAVIVERRVDHELESTRAGGLQARTIEVLDQRGVAERFLAEGTVMQINAFAGVPLDISDFPTRHPYGLALWQRDFERILAAWVEELGVRILRGREVVGFTQRDDGVEVSLSAGTSISAGYLVGCDGGRSLVRRHAGIDFPGTDASTSWMIAEVALDDPEVGVRREGGGIGPIDRFGGTGGPYGVVLKDPRVERGQPTLTDLRRALVTAYGDDFGARDPGYLSRFDDACRLAATYRSGRVLLAGDAAHIHPPQGGQGLNTGVQDAVNLGWKLAQVVRGVAPEQLLDTYHQERQPVAARVLQTASAQVVLAIDDDRHDALRQIVGELLAIDDARRRVAGMLSGLDITYETGDHPLVGRRMPDVELHTATGATHVFALLHVARPLLLELAGSDGFDLGGWTDRVLHVQARGGDTVEVPVLGQVSMPPAVLVRPDGHVAWAGELGDPALAESLTRWFGARTPRAT